MYFRVDVDQHPDWVTVFSIPSTPYFVFFDNDKEIARTDGASVGDWVHFKNTIAKELKNYEHKDTWNPEDHEGNVTKKETRRTGSNRYAVSDYAKKVDQDRIKDDAVYDGFKFEKDGEGETDYSLEKTA
jgi:thioredoxin-related protein